MPRIKRIYLGEGTAAPGSPAQLPPNPPLAPGDVGWPAAAPGLPNGPQVTQQFTHGPQTGVTQVVYYPVPTASTMTQPIARSGPAKGWGCLFELITVVLVIIAAWSVISPSSFHAIIAQVLGYIGASANSPEVTIQTASTAQTIPVQITPAPPAADRTFRYDNPPSISLERYQAILCNADSPACPEAAAMYDAVTSAGIDPALELAHAWKETGYGLTGVGRVNVGRNLHGVRCNNWDGGSCVDGHSAYSNYTDSVRAWSELMTTQGTYIDAGKTTPDTVIPIYCPPLNNQGELECDTATYIQQMKDKVQEYRQIKGSQTQPQPNTSPTAVIAPTSEVVPSTRVMVTVTRVIWDGKDTQITVTLTNTSPTALTINNEAIQVTSSSNAVFTLPMDTEPLSLDVGRSLDLDLRIAGQPAQPLNLLLLFPPDPPLIVPLAQAR